MPYLAAGIENLELLRYLKIFKKNFRRGVFYYIYHYFFRHPLGGGKMLLDSTSRELSFKTVRTEEISFGVVLTALTYLGGLIITAESIGVAEAKAPSEGQDWNWEDYE